MRLARELMAATEQPILGVGVGSPGVVDPEGVVLEAANLGWHDLPLARHLGSVLDLPVHVANDANAAVLADYALGDESSDNLLLVKVGKGVGAGLLIAGQLFTGDRSAAGEIGHVTVDERASLCACGRRGCLETAIAVPRLRARLAVARDERARVKVLEAAGRRLGLALATVVSALNLDDVVLSGPPDVVTEAFRAAALATIRRRTIPSVGEHVSLRFDSLGDDDVLLGAAVLVRSAELGVASSARRPTPGPDRSGEARPPTDTLASPGQDLPNQDRFGGVGPTHRARCPAGRRHRRGVAGAPAPRRRASARGRGRRRRVSRLLLAGGSVVHADRIEPADVLVVDGLVAAVGPRLEAPDGGPTIDVSGLLVAPGFIDLQINGAHGIDLADEPERHREVGAALTRYGVTGFLPTVITSPAGTPERAMAALAARPPGFVGAEPLGLHLEGPMLAPVRRGAHDPALLRPPSQELIEGWTGPRASPW